MFALLLLAAAADVAAASPTPACSKPTLASRPGMPATEAQATLQRAQTYVECMTKAIEAQRSIANDLLEKARAEAQKNNDMIKEVNDFVAQAKTFQEQQSGG